MPLGLALQDGAKLRLPAVREAIEQKWRATPPMPAPVVCGDDGEGLRAARTTGFCGGFSEARSSPKERLDLGGDRVGSSCPWPPEEHPLSKRSPPPCSPAQVHFGAVEGEQGLGGWNLEGFVRSAVPS